MITFFYLTAYPWRNGIFTEGASHWQSYVASWMRADGFFCRIEGRRRIGKTSLLSQLAKEDPALADRLLYMQVPDSDERDVATTFQRALNDCDRPEVQQLAREVVDFPSMARTIGQLCRLGMVVVIDEFQYFTRAALKSFNSFFCKQKSTNYVIPEFIKAGCLSSARCTPI